MFMKIAKARKNNKGFSLIELIIVIAIMVALIAVMAPQFIKYVQSARNSALTDAANNYLEVIKAEYAQANIKGTGAITISVDSSNGHFKATVPDSITLAKGSGNAADYIFGLCGIDSAKNMGTVTVSYTITVGTDAATGAATFTMVENTVA